MARLEIGSKLDEARFARLTLRQRLFAVFGAKLELEQFAHARESGHQPRLRAVHRVRIEAKISRQAWSLAFAEFLGALGIDDQ
jgi:hypothetical protein